MAIELRKSGVDVVGELPWGSHFCLFYEAKEDLLEIAPSYCQAGLEGQEFCLWVVAEPLTVEDARHALKRAVPDSDRYFAEGSMEIVAARDWYLQDGTFDLNRMIRGWNEKLAWASARGYAGVRVTGDTAWLEKKDWTDFCEYEESLNQAVTNQRLAVLCTYPGSGSSMKVSALSRLSWAHECVHSEKSAISLLLEMLFIADPGSLLIFPGGTRSDPAIYSATTSTMITMFELPCGSGAPNQFDGVLRHTMTQLRATPRANRTLKSADSPIPCATSNTAVRPVCEPSPLSRWDDHDASPSARSGGASPAHNEPRRGRIRSVENAAGYCPVLMCPRRCRPPLDSSQGMSPR